MQEGGEGVRFKSCDVPHCVRNVAKSSWLAPLRRLVQVLIIAALSLTWTTPKLDLTTSRIVHFLESSALEPYFITEFSATDTIGASGAITPQIA